QVGPTQSFQPNSLGGSAAFTANAPQTPPGLPTGNGGSGGGGTGTATGAPGGGKPATIPNILVLTGAASDIARAKEILSQIDVKLPQITYEAKVVDIGSTDLTQLGFKYDFSAPITIGEANRGEPTTLGANNVQARPPQFGAIFRSPYTIGVGLEALMKNDKTR